MNNIYEAMAEQLKTRAMAGEVGAMKLISQLLMDGISDDEAEQVWRAIELLLAEPMKF